MGGGLVTGYQMQVWVLGGATSEDIRYFLPVSSGANSDNDACWSYHAVKFIDFSAIEVSSD